MRRGSECERSRAHLATWSAVRGWGSVLQCSRTTPGHSPTALCSSRPSRHPRRRRLLHRCRPHRVDHRLAPPDHVFDPGDCSAVLVGLHRVRCLDSSLLSRGRHRVGSARPTSAGTVAARLPGSRRLRPRQEQVRPSRRALFPSCLRACAMTVAAK
jgi:hypothetical protein